jgi:hypothetical protein
LEVYEGEYDPHHPWVCLDESPKQLISQVRKSFRDSKGVIYQDFEYRREGVVDLYLVCEPLVGSREIFVRDNHNRLTWAEIICYLALEKYPEAKRITIVQDNLSAHKPSALYEIMSPEEARRILRRIEFVHTPKHGSWLNIAEIELSLLSRLGVAKRVSSKAELEKQIESYQTRRNAKQAKVNWQFTTKEARIKLKRLYPSIES